MKIKLIDNWKHSWKFGSIKISAIGLIISGAFEFMNDTWNDLPSFLQNHIPHSSLISIVLFTLNILARITTIVRKETEEDGSVTQQ